MGERKVINKYYPPDFDPDLIPKRRRPRNQHIKVRMMLPMSIRCTVCGEYLGVGKKFNAKKETVEGEEYLGLKIFRFYIRCVRCSAEITLKTDPKNSDYIAERNCVRNFEGSKNRDDDEGNTDTDDSLEEDAMKQLENKTLETRLEMEQLDDLEEIKTLNALSAKITADDLLKFHQEKKLKEQMENEQKIAKEDEEEIKKIFSTVKRVEETENEKNTSQPQLETPPLPINQKKENSILSGVSIKIKKKKKKSLLNIGNKIKMKKLVDY